jgi:23S rRNA (cytidine1920-2'-O)/16S rRNA (cytidine1409-2'-O)-methyltransferase
MSPSYQTGSSRPSARRLDQALVDCGLCLSREKAQRAILAGLVRINRQLAHKPSDRVKPDDLVELELPERYVSRGGLKLEHGLKEFGIDVADLTAIDLGASTGGFTDCLLQHGVKRVYAVDVGTGQLAWKLRQDSRVVVMEHTNARMLSTADFPPGAVPVDLVVIDCSFISLRLLLPVAQQLVRAGGMVLPLVKPQFEVGKREADRGRGVITDPKLHQQVLTGLQDYVKSCASIRWLKQVESPLLGPAGNKEFLVLLEKLA